jgi:hypothetical protein
MKTMKIDYDLRAKLTKLGYADILRYLQNASDDDDLKRRALESAKSLAFDVKSLVGKPNAPRRIAGKIVGRPGHGFSFFPKTKTDKRATKSVRHEPVWNPDVGAAKRAFRRSAKQTVKRGGVVSRIASRMMK